MVLTIMARRGLTTLARNVRAGRLTTWANAIRGHTRAVPTFRVPAGLSANLVPGPARRTRELPPGPGRPTPDRGRLNQAPTYGPAFSARRPSRSQSPSPSDECGDGEPATGRSRPA